MENTVTVMAAKLIDRRFHNVPGLCILAICTVERYEHLKTRLLLTEF
jgi:hypothetical protein